MALKQISTRELRRELERRGRQAGQLVAEKDKLEARLAVIAAELDELGAPASGPGRKRGRKPGRKPGRRKVAGKRPGRSAASAGGRRRARNAKPLPEVILEVVKAGATVTPAEVAKLVRRRGFKTTARNFGMMVSNALAKMSKDFQRVARGQYRRTK